MWNLRLTKQVSATKLGEGVTLLVLIQIKRVCGSCGATGKCLQGRNCHQVRSSSYLNRLHLWSSLQSNLYKKNKVIVVWACRCGCCAAYPLGWQMTFISLHRVEGLCDSRMGLKVCTWRWKTEEEMLGLYFPSRFSSSITFSSGACFCAF